MIEIRVPPLAERVDDILPLAEHFLADGKRLAPDAREALRRYTWPGNVRELRNALQRAALLAQGEELSAADLGLPAGAPAASPEELDRAAIEVALARADGVIAQAAAELGLSRQALYRRMEKLGIAAGLSVCRGTLALSERSGPQAATQAAPVAGRPQRAGRLSPGRVRGGARAAVRRLAGRSGAGRDA